MTRLFSKGSALLLAAIAFGTLANTERALAGAACSAVIAAQENNAVKMAQAVGNNVNAQAQQVQTNQQAAQNASKGCLSGLSKFGGNSQFPSMGSLLSMLEDMGCSMATGVAMGAVSSVTSAPLNAASQYGLTANAGFGQSGMTTQPGGPPPILTSTTSSLMGSAAGGASSVFGNIGSSVSTKVESAPGVNQSTLPGTNRATQGMSNSFNNVYK